MIKFNRYQAPPAQPPPVATREAARELALDYKAPEPARGVVMTSPLPAAPLPVIAGVKVLVDRVEFTSPKIKLVEFIFVGKLQTDKLEPKKAYVAHGVLVIEELGLALHGATFRVTF